MSRSNEPTWWQHVEFLPGIDLALWAGVLVALALGLTIGLVCAA